MNDQPPVIDLNTKIQNAIFTFQSRREGCEQQAAEIRAKARTPAYDGSRGEKYQAAHDHLIGKAVEVESEAKYWSAVEATARTGFLLKMSGGPLSVRPETVFRDLYADAERVGRVKHLKPDVAVSAYAMNYKVPSA